MPANILTQVREAVWSALEGSSELATFIADGRAYTLDEGGYLPTRISKGDCPALAVIPAECPVERFGESLEELRYALRAVGYLYTEQAAEAEEFLLLIHDALCDAAPDLGLSSVKALTLGALTFTPHFDRASGRYWEVSLTVEAAIQQ